MRIRFFCLLPALMFVVLAGCSGGSSEPSPAEKLQASVNANWTQYTQAHGLPGGGMAVYLETPTGNYFASSGMAAGVDQNTRFRIQSNTKTFTAAAIMLLNQQGKLNIDDFIVSNIPGQGAPYVPATAQYNIPYKASIKIRELLSHTAGAFDVGNDAIPDTCAAPYAGKDYTQYVLDTDPYHQFSPDEFVGVVATCQISYFAPGDNYHYSNTGYSILAIIIERVSGVPYDQFVVQNLVTPNGLASTSVPMLGWDQTIPAPFNPGYLWNNGTFTDVTQSNMSTGIAEGNIISTPADLARWVRRLIRGEAGLNSVSVDAMKTVTPPSRSYGLGIINMGSLGYGHNGAGNGYLSNMAYDPVTDVTTILYCNVEDYANVPTYQLPLLVKASKDARAAVGY
ncbi:MAG: serine hydrolase domain-containing protein [Syntrophorhabdales bacterium]